MKRVLVALMLIGGGLFAPLARGQFISWGCPQDIGGDADVVTSGVRIGAFTIRPSADSVSSLMVNGVTFEKVSIGTDPNPTCVTFGDFKLQETVTALAASTNFGAESGDFAELSCDYRKLLSSGVYATEGDTESIRITMSNLVTGHDYLFQWWHNDSSFAERYSTTTGDSITLTSNTGNSYGSLGQYGIGTFTADGTSLMIEFTGVGDSAPMINAFQLRDVTAVPEPSTYAGLTGIVALGWALMLRRRQANEG